MGSDDLFKQRRRRASRELVRKKAKRDAYDRVLIVCEGEKTEPNYLAELIDYLKLNSANVEVEGSTSSSPDSIWAYAKRQYQDEQGRGDSYDRVYCVFDKDSHASYAATVQAIHAANPKDTFYAITSVPCFEYWILLHFEFATRPYNRTGRESPCDGLIRDLKEKGYMPDYAKGERGIFAQIMGQTDQAIAFSKRALNQAQRADTDNPTSLMHEMVEYLRDLK